MSESLDDSRSGQSSHLPPSYWMMLAAVSPLALRDRKDVTSALVLLALSIVVYKVLRPNSSQSDSRKDEGKETSRGLPDRLHSTDETASAVPKDEPSETTEITAESPGDPKKEDSQGFKKDIGVEENLPGDTSADPLPFSPSLEVDDSEEPLKHVLTVEPNNEDTLPEPESSKDVNSKETSRGVPDHTQSTHKAASSVPKHVPDEKTETTKESSGATEKLKPETVKKVILEEKESSENTNAAPHISEDLPSSLDEDEFKKHLTHALTVEPDEEDLHVMFAEMDVADDENAKIPHNAVEKAIFRKGHHCHLKPAVVERAFGAADKDENGYLNKTEFVSFLRLVTYFQNLMDVFQKMDTNHDRRLSRREFTMASSLLDIEPENAEEVWTEMSQAHNGDYVVFDEFCLWMAQQKAM